jgi:hypothetical protein
MKADEWQVGPDDRWLSSSMTLGHTAIATRHRSLDRSVGRHRAIKNSDT